MWFVALAGLAWLLVRRLGQRGPVVHVPPVADPADELRRKLDESKEREAESSEPPADFAPPPDSDEIEARRRDVRAQARATAEEMRRSGSD